MNTAVVWLMMPVDWDVSRAVAAINNISNETVGWPVFYDTPQEARQTNVAAGAKVEMVEVQVTFTVMPQADGEAK